MNRRPWPIIRNLEAILKDGRNRNSLGYKAKGSNMGIAANSMPSIAKPLARENQNFGGAPGVRKAREMGQNFGKPAIQ